MENKECPLIKSLDATVHRCTPGPDYACAVLSSMEDDAKHLGQDNLNTLRLKIKEIHGGHSDESEKKLHKQIFAETVKRSSNPRYKHLSREQIEALWEPSREQTLIEVMNILENLPLHPDVEMQKHIEKVYSHAFHELQVPIPIYGPDDEVIGY